MIRLFKYYIGLVLLLGAHKSLAQRPLAMVQKGHTLPINELDISPNGKYLISGGMDKVVNVWDIETGKLITGFITAEETQALMFYANEMYLWGGYGNYGNSWILYDFSGENTQSIDVGAGVMDMKWSPSKDMYGVGFSGGAAYIFDVEKDTSYQFFSGDDQSVESVAFSPNNHYFAYCAGFMADGKIVVSEINGGKTIFQHSDSLIFENIEFIDNENLLVRANYYSAMNRLYRLSLVTGKLELISEDYGEVALTLDRSSFYTVKNQNLIKYDLSKKKETELMKLPDSLDVKGVISISEDGNTLALAQSDILIIDLRTITTKQIIESDKTRVDDIALHPNGEEVAFNGNVGEIVSMSLKTGEFSFHQINKKRVVQLCYDMSGSALVTASLDSTITVWNPDMSVKYWWSLEDNEFNSLSLSKDGRYLSVSVGDTVHFLDLVEGVRTDKLDFGVASEKKVLYSPNDRDLGIITGNALILYDFSKDTFNYVQLQGSSLADIAFSSDGRYVAVGGFNDSVQVFSTPDLKLVSAYSTENDYVSSLEFEAGTYRLAVGMLSGRVDILDVTTHQKITGWPHFDNVKNMTFSSENNTLLSTSYDGRIVISDSRTLIPKANLYTFMDGTWAIIDAEGRYDASNAGDIDHLHYSVQNVPVSLDQLKERYYEPGLLQKLLGYSDEPLRDVSGLGKVNLYPEIKLSIKEDQLIIDATLRDRSLGIISFYINGIERKADISTELKASDSIHYSTTIDLKLFKEFFLETSFNKIGVKAYNADNYLVSDLFSIAYKPDRKDKTYKSFFDGIKVQEPKLFAIVVGTSDYLGEKLDLKYADDDADKFASALLQSGSLLYGAENVSVKLLNTKSENKPSKENIQAEFERIKSLATSKDVLVVYLSGHGTTFMEEGQDHFFYMTMSLSSGKIDDPEIRKKYTVSTRDLSDWISEIPVQKQVLIIDACSSGKAIENMLASAKSSGTSNERAMQRIKDRVGTFILAGSAANQESFESPKFGQSLLTYSLLSAMKGERLREGQFVDVYEMFDHAIQMVPIHAASIGTVQRPFMAQPKGGASFDIGKIDSSVVIQLAMLKPSFVRSNFQEPKTQDDILDLSAKMDELLMREAYDRDAYFDFIDVRKLDNAYAIRGSYTIEGEIVSLSCTLRRNMEELTRLEIKGEKTDLNSLLTKALEQMIQFVE